METALQRMIRVVESLQFNSQIDRSLDPEVVAQEALNSVGIPHDVDAEDIRIDSFPEGGIDDEISKAVGYTHGYAQPTPRDIAVLGRVIRLRFGLKSGYYPSQLRFDGKGGGRIGKDK